MTIGDVLGVTGLLFGLGICSWAVMMATAFLFPTRSKLARHALEENAGPTVFKGSMILAAGVLVSIVLLQIPNPLAKLIGWVLLVGMLAVSAVGSGGLAFLMGSRLREFQPGMTEYEAACRGAALVFLSALTPILGTFLIAPLALGASFGAGLHGLRVRASAPVNPNA